MIELTESQKKILTSLHRMGVLWVGRDAPQIRQILDELVELGLAKLTPSKHSRRYEPS